MARMWIAINFLQKCKSLSDTHRRTGEHQQHPLPAQALQGSTEPRSADRQRTRLQAAAHAGCEPHQRADDGANSRTRRTAATKRDAGRSAWPDAATGRPDAATGWATAVRLFGSDAEQCR